MTDSSPALTVIHTSDWHLGHELNGHDRQIEHDVFLNWLLEQIETQAAHVLLVTGDIYDVANPPVSAMRRLFRFLNAATARIPGLQVVILGGNHDSAGRIDLPSALLGDGRVHFIGSLPRRDGLLDMNRVLIPLHDCSAQLAGWLAAVPFCRPGDLGIYSLPTLYAEVTDAGMTKADGLPLILTGHLHVAGGDVSELSERRIVVGGEEAQAASLFDARPAYVALGHLHRPQAVTAATTVRYAGSPFPLSSTERDYRHSIAVVRLKPEGCEVDLVPIPRPVAFLSIGPFPLDDAVTAIEALQLDPAVPIERWPFIEIAVRIDGPEPHLQSRILAALEAKPVRLVRILSVRREASEATLDPMTGANLAELAPHDVFAAIFRRDYGGEAPPEDLAAAFAQLLVEAETAEEDR
ncbi:exonuclease SbcCD subunit D C-terminal domain-containing protein [Novosphingobium terrae]|uniref:exonuclease SbcCD subunit D C-terminal domain-containing protein n=1 Tax=Novosphingobium terrae TaxID=2726189 RepID=UPI00197FC46F|nr:exonuclease SbcCD subunit D C-terminal domain-containing protein [Novosphingobium terrae]